MKVLITEAVSEQGIKLLEAEHEVDICYGLTQMEFLEILPEYDAIIAGSGIKVTAEALEKAQHLKVIGRAGISLETIDVQAATRQGILVLNAPDGNTVAAAEHSFAMMLALARNIPQAYQSLKEGNWERRKFTGVGMEGKTLGIIGLGRIGSAVAKRALAFDMTVLAYDPFIPEGKGEELGVEIVGLERIYAEADFITLHVPLTAETRVLMNSDAFAQMKRGVRIIQCARGGIIQEAALLEAIHAGIVAGVAIDVFEKEPVDPNHPLLKREEVIYTPHLVSLTREAQIGMAVNLAEGILMALRGETVGSAVNMPSVSRTVMDFIRPYLDLAEKMGTLAVHLADARIESVEVQYKGEISEVDCKMLTTAIVKGILNPILQESVNFVNALSVAKSRGIKIREMKSEENEYFTNLINVRVRTDQGEHRVAGTLFSREETRIVMIDGYRVDVEPRGWLLIIPHTDYPGRVGKVGSILGENHINIKGMQVGRTERIGTNIMVVSVEQEVSQEVLLKLKEQEGIYGAKLVYFNGLTSSTEGGAK